MDQKAISINLSSKLFSSYTNPFQSRAIDWMKIDTKSFKKLKENKFKKMKDIIIQNQNSKKESIMINSDSKKFYTADLKQENGVEDQGKPLNYR